MDVRLAIDQGQNRLMGGYVVGVTGVHRLLNPATRVHLRAARVAVTHEQGWLLAVVHQHTPRSGRLPPLFVR